MSKSTWTTTLPRRSVLVALAMGALTGLLGVALAVTSGWLIVRSAQRPAVLLLTVPMGLVQLFAIGRAVARYRERLLTHDGALLTMAEIRRDVARGLATKIPHALGPRVSDAVDVVIHDVELVQNGIIALAGPLASAVVATVAIALCAGFLSPALALILALAVLTGGVLIPTAISTLGISAQQQRDQAVATRRQLISDLTQWREVTESSGSLNRVLHELDLAEDEVDRVSRRWAAQLAALHAASAAVVGLSLWAAGCLTSSVVAGHGRVMAAVPLLLTLAIGEIVLSVAPAAAAVSGARVALRRLVDAAEPLAPLPGAGLSIAGDLTLHHVEVPAGELVVQQDLSWNIAEGSFWHLRGPSGVGKTSVAHLLARFVDPRHGVIARGGVNVKEVSPSALRSEILFSSDSPHVFTGSLAANLRLACPTASDDDLGAALHQVGLDEFYATLPMGLDTVISPTTISGGETRRLAAARVLLSGRATVVLDEPTEGLGARAADQLIESLTSGRTAVVISHRDVHAPNTLTLS